MDYSNMDLWWDSTEKVESWSEELLWMISEWAISAVAMISLLCFFLFGFTTLFWRPSDRSEEEKYFYDPNSKGKLKFPSLYDPASKHLSLIIPAYNEGQRLEFMLDECLKELRLVPLLSFEVIVVSDGSTDNTAELAYEYAARFGVDTFRVLKLEKNRGKGGAVRLGMESARGAVLLFADADGATRFSDLNKLEKAMEFLVEDNYKAHPGAVAEKRAIVCGSRAHLEDKATATRSCFRTILMHGFHLLVWLFAVRGVRDTQCGFKLLTRSAARVCFKNLHVESWAFDVELLYLAEKLKIPIVEVAVNWTEIGGSKLVPVLSWLQMGRDVVLIWLRYFSGVWKVEETECFGEHGRPTFLNN